MRLDANNPISLGALDDALRNAQQPSLDLFSKIINSACTRIQARGQALTHIVRRPPMLHLLSAEEGCARRVA
jgi:hypothetical protein